MTTILIANNAAALQAAEPHVTVEAEFGDAVVTGSLLTMAHHGPRAGGKAPCAYANDCLPTTPGLVIGVSHADLDTAGGVMAAMGCKPDAPSFWALAEFVDLNGAHKLGLSGASEEDLRRLYAFWAVSKTVRIYAPRDGTVADVTADMLKLTSALKEILRGEGVPYEARLAAGMVFKAQERALNEDSFVRFERGVILRHSAQFVNHLYTTPDGRVAKAVVTWNNGTDLSNGAITASLADPTPGIHVGDLLKTMFGPEAGGHAGIGGAPRGQAMPKEVAEKVAFTLGLALGAIGHVKAAGLA